jgi:hypothetical protein
MRHLRNAIKCCAALLTLTASMAAHAERNIDRDLRNASKAGDLPEMGRQLQLGADPDVAYALYAAADGGQLPALQFLLAHGADPNAWTRLALRLPRGPAASPLYVAAHEGHREILAYLKSHGGDLNAATTDRASATCSTVLIEALCEGDLTAAQLLIEAGADVNQRSNTGDPPLTLALTAPNNKSALVELLLRHGGDPDAKNSQGASLRKAARVIPGLPALVEQVKPRPPGQLDPEEPLEVAAALHYKMVCDIGEPGYADRVRADYTHWRIVQAAVIAQVESSPDYPQQLAAAKAEFEKTRQQATGEDAQHFNESLRQVCDARLAAHFRTGEPLFEQSPDPHPEQTMQALIKSRTPPAVKSVITVHKGAPAPVLGGTASVP